MHESINQNNIYNMH